MAVATYIEDLFDQYKIERKLAEKRYTDLYLAYDVDEDRAVTLDLLRSLDEPDSDFAAEFVTRARAMAQIRHPNISRVYDVGFGPNTHPFVAQELIDGVLLSERLDQLAQRDSSANGIYALKLMRQLAEALLLAERLDLFHYDLQPDNVRLKNVTLPTDESVLLIDLFVPFRAQKVGDQTADDPGLVYLSPEQKAGKSITGSSHVYSLGVMSYQLLSGELPAHSVSQLEVTIRKLTAGSSPLEQARPGLTPETYQLVDRSLRSDPGRRYASIESFLEGLDGALVAEELRLVTTAAPAKVAGGRSWGLMIPLLSLILVALAGLTAVGFSRVRTGNVDALTPAAATNLLDGLEPDNALLVAGLPSPTVTASPEPELTATVDGTSQGNDDGQVAAGQDEEDSAVAGIVEDPTLTATVTPTMTPEPTSTPEPTATATATMTATPLPRVRVVLNSVNVRRGPGTAYPQLEFLLQGDEVIVIAVTGEGDNQWYLVRLEDDQVGWIAVSVVEGIDDNVLLSIPTAATIPATPVPTATATPTATPTLASTGTPTPEDPGNGDNGNGDNPTQPAPTQAPPTQPPEEPTRTPPPFP